MQESNFVSIQQRDQYAVVRLSEESVRMADAQTLEKAVLRDFCMPPLCLRQNGFASGTSREAGLLKHGQLLSAGRPGFVQLGPYSPMVPGRYRLTVYGAGVSAGHGWVEVVSGHATARHARLPLSVNPADNKARGNVILAEGVVRLYSRVEDLEIRMFVGEGDVVLLDGYELVPVVTAAKVR
jgi:hypothetical protein